MQANGPAGDGVMSYHVALAPGGRFVAFLSDATNLVPVGSRDPWWDVFLRDRQTGRNELISVATDGGPADGDSYGVSISEGGRFVAFKSQASNLVAGDTNMSGDVFVRIR